MSSPTEVIEALETVAAPEVVATVARFFTGVDPDTRVMGIQIGKIFPVAKRFTCLPLEGVEALLEDPRYEVRMAAVAILDFKAREKGLGEEERADLFNLYIRRHDRINNWDLVDRAAPHVVGEYLLDKDRSALERLARSEDPHRRCTAIVATYAFIKRGNVRETFRIASILAGDRDVYVQKAIASWTREAGKRDPNALIAFLRANRNLLAKSTITNASKLLPENIRAGLRA